MPSGFTHGALPRCTLAQAWSSMHPPRVLLAEDDDDLRSFLAMELRRDGFEVVEARDGQELCDEVAAVAARRPPPVTPDIIVSDIRMPLRSGLEAVAALRRTDRTTAVVLMTGYGDQAAHDEARHLGVAAVFDKPFDVDDLRTAVLNLVKRTSR